MILQKIVASTTDGYTDIVSISDGLSPLETVIQDQTVAISTKYQTVAISDDFTKIVASPTDCRFFHQKWGPKNGSFEDGSGLVSGQTR